MLSHVVIVSQRRCGGQHLHQSQRRQRSRRWCLKLPKTFWRMQHLVPAGFRQDIFMQPKSILQPLRSSFFHFFYRRSSSFLIGDLWTGHVPTGTPVMAMSLSQGSCPERLLSNGQAGSAVKWRCGRQHSVWQTVWHMKLIETVSQLWGFVKGIGAAKLLQAPLILQQLW